MCGICGVVDFSGREVPIALVESMASTLAHRGPDHSGALRPRSEVALGHTRLSILDLSDLGNQPMSSDDGAIHLVYNGEIFNFRELRAQLEAAGERFRSRSDTEVVLRAFMRWGVEGIAKLRGMYAIAIWDERRRALHLARDWPGIKPLYVARSGGRVGFASEIKALLAGGLVSRNVDTAALHEYLYFGTSLGERTLFADVEKLPPGHVLTITADAVQRRDGSPAPRLAAPQWSFEQAAHELRRTLRDVVARHLISDVPVGLFLSGGLDSSSILAFAARAEQPLQTFSADFDFAPEGSELPAARALAASFGTSHREVHISAQDFAPTLRALVRAHDLPFGDAANAPLYLMAQQIRRDVKVVLQGDGGDEIFGGYRRYRLLSRARALALGGRVARRLLRHARRQGELLHRTRRLAEAFARDATTRMALLLTEETLVEPPTRVLEPAYRVELERTDPFERYRVVARRLEGLDDAKRMMWTDCAIVLPDIFLEKVDRATMAHGVEARVPLLDRELMEFALALPTSYLVDLRRSKRLLRRAMAPLLPQAVVAGRKHGFGVPYAAWLRGPLAETTREVLFDPGLRDWGVLDDAALRSLVREHETGRPGRGFLLYKVLQLALWKQEVLERAG